MALKISANTFFVTRYLKVDRKGVSFAETAIGGARKFRFDQIECVLMSNQNVLSFQVGNQVFSLPVKPGNKKHEETIAALLQGVEQSRQPMLAPTL